MAQPTTTPKIEELRARLKGDPKTRQFFPLAEELRKIDRHDEAEKVLREGLTHHPTYLSAWISLGRVLSEAGRNQQAVEVLEKALTLDQGNVVAARLLAEAYLALGEKVAAIKKFKLVNALMPNDEATEAHIDALDRELNPEKYGAAPAPAAGAPAPASAPAPAPAPEPIVAAPSPVEAPATGASEAAAPVPEPAPPEPPRQTDDVFSMSAAAESQAPPSHDDGDVFSMTETPEVAPTSPPSRPSPEETFPFPPPPKFEPPSPVEDEDAWAAPSAPAPAVSSESPFADLPPAPPSPPAFEMDEPSPFGAAGPAALPVEEDSSFEGPPVPAEEVEEPQAAHAPAEDESPFEEPEAAPPPAEEEPSFEEPQAAAPPAEDPTTTVTMADLYAKQGHYDQARDIYQRMLERDPMNRELRQKLDAMPSATPAPMEDAVPPAESGRGEAVHRLESWLTKVKKDGPRV
ncbi:MAG TPA: tetratricopeptide repeat protein [Thermoanaerobaculia bacterium]